MHVKRIAAAALAAAAATVTLGAPALASPAFPVPVPCTVTYTHTPADGPPGSPGDTTSETMTCGTWTGPATYTISLSGGRYPTVAETLYPHENVAAFVPSSQVWTLTRGEVLTNGVEATFLSVPGLVPYYWLPRITVTRSRHYR